LSSFNLFKIKKKEKTKNIKRRMALAGKLLRGALLHSRTSGLLFPGAAATSAVATVRVNLSRPIVTSNSLGSDKALTDNEEKRVAIIGAIQEDLTPLTGIPELHVKHRRVRIFMPAKNAMQSGTNNTKKWRLEFDAWERWDNRLMGWCSTGDPLSNLVVEFSDLEDAIAYCEKHKWNFEVEYPQKLRRLKKSYGENYSWNKRTRTSAK